MDEGEVAIVDVRIAASDGSASEIARGEGLSVEIDYAIATPVGSPIFCITVIDVDGGTRFSASTDQVGIVIPESSSSGHLSARLHSIDLDPGTYFIDVGVYEANWKYAYDYHSRAYPLIVRHGGNAAREPQLVTTKVAWLHNAREASDPV